MIWILRKQYGDVFTLHLGQKRVVLMTSWDMVDRHFKNFNRWESSVYSIHLIYLFHFTQSIALCTVFQIIYVINKLHMQSGCFQ